MPLTDRQLEANRANAQLSTGPRTPEGKAVSSRNALKTGLTGRTMVFSLEEGAWYELHLRRYEQDLAPQTHRERELVQRLADTEWRLNRIPVLEQGIYTLGRQSCADLFPDEEDPGLRDVLIEHHIFVTYSRQLNNLSIQESRLRRYYAKDMAELKSLQAERLAAQPAEPAEAVPAVAPAAQAPAIPENGFEFSSAVQSAAVVAQTGPLPAELPLSAPPKQAEPGAF
jgi:hypothetical protein